MPDRSGLEIARLLRDEIPQTKIMVISQHDARQMLPRVIEAGGHACVGKARSSTDILEGIKRISGLAGNSQNTPLNCCRQSPCVSRIPPSWAGSSAQPGLDRPFDSA